MNIFFSRTLTISQKDADELIKIYRQVPADLINIIEYNPIDALKFSKPDEEYDREVYELPGSKPCKCKTKKKPRQGY